MEKVADWGVVDHVIQGGYFKSGDDFRIHIQIQKADSWEIIGTETLSGQIDNYTRMVDELTPRIKSYFNLSAQDIAEDIDLDIGQITGSAEAFAYFYEGMKFWGSDNHTEAVEAFKKAIEIDPQFAMAHTYLAKIYSNYLLQSNQAREHWEKASGLVERLTDRERYFVEAALSSPQDAVEPLKKILELYPKDWLANYELGNRYYHMEEWEKARELLLENKRNKVDFPLNYRTLARVYEYQGSYDEAIETCRYLNSAGKNLFAGKTHAVLCRGWKSRAKGQDWYDFV